MVSPTCCKVRAKLLKRRWHRPILSLPSNRRSRDKIPIWICKNGECADIQGRCGHSIKVANLNRERFIATRFLSILGKTIHSKQTQAITPGTSSKTFDLWNHPLFQAILQHSLFARSGSSLSWNDQTVDVYQFSLDPAFSRQLISNASPKVFKERNL
jgi:hypothetical protein